MIWSSLPWTVAFDLLIVIVVAMLVAYILKVRGFSNVGGASPGRWTLLAGISLTGAFYLVDLLVMLVLPGSIGRVQAMQVMQQIHLEIRWPVSMLSIALIFIGIYLLLEQRRKLEQRVHESEHLLDSVRHSAVQSESRFRSVLEQNPYSIYCFELDPPFPLHRGAQALTGAIGDARLVECNGAFARSIELPSVRVALGHRFGDLDSAHDKSHAKLIRDFVASRYRLSNYELIYKGPKGDDRALKLSWDGVIKNGLLKRIWGAEQDILAVKKTEAELAGRKRFESLVASVSTKLIVAPDDKLADELRNCLALLCGYADSDRAVLLWMDDASKRIELLSFWNEHGSPPWEQLPKDAFPWSSGMLLSGKPFVVDDIEQLHEDAPIDYKSYVEFGALSMAGVPLSVGGAVLGALTITNVAQKRHWSKTLIQELDVLGGLFANTVWRIRSRQALDVALAQLRQARDHLEAENVYLQQELRSTHGFDGLIGDSHPFMKSLRQVEQVAATKTAVLIQGETGTGKELIARAIHSRSDRNKRPLVKVNCAALPGNLIESELFGHEKGAFTGAQSRKRGRFDLAHRGTLFLDEIGDFPLELQGKLLRVLQEGEFERLGGSETLKVDVRLIAATNRNLRDAVDRGEFRADLYYRISTFPIELAALRDRQGDIALLARHFVIKYAKQLGKDVKGLSTYMLDQLENYSWPGNVRELESVVQRAIIYASGPVINLHEQLQTAKDEKGSENGLTVRGQPDDLHELERDHIRFILEQANWTIAGEKGAAARLGLPPSTLRSKMKKFGIERPAASA